MAPTDYVTCVVVVRGDRPGVFAMGYVAAAHFTFLFIPVRSADSIARMPVFTPGADKVTVYRMVPPMDTGT